MKYKAKKTVLDGIKFDSKAEAEYYALLLEQKKRGEILEIVLQPKVYLTKARLLYKPDFWIKTPTEDYYVDVKGFKTAVFALKARLWKFYGAGELRLVKKKGKGFTQIEVISMCSLPH